MPAVTVVAVVPGHVQLKEAPKKGWLSGAGNGWIFSYYTGTQMVGRSVTPSLGSIMIDPGSRVPRF